ncbi:LysR family transcriptional regulator [Acinetobacter calcoaceticus]|uniref:LysR family transcriptional regulator n=1 Tax=Acinetobacter calcoaceticus TaxID=471 RepID=A0A4R1XBR9_ACICA|nr:LysR family transcriptional regulator [Acinetobacter calcoaceticus]
MRLDAINFDALRTFEMAAHELSFTKAAKHLNITQSAVSQQIRMLETRLGYALFIRQSRSLALTEKGSILFDSVSKSFHDIHQTLKYLSLPNASLQINCLPSFALQWLMPRLSLFHLDQPRINVKLKAEFQALSYYDMQHHNIDLGLRFDPHVQSDLHTEILMDEYLIPVATPEYLAKHPRFAAGEAFDRVTLLHDATPWMNAPEFIEWETWLKQAKPEWLNRLGGVEFNLSSLAISAALNHQGVAIGRMALIHDEIENGKLVNIFNLPVRSTASYKILSPRHPNPELKDFIRWLKSQSNAFVQKRNQMLHLDVESIGPVDYS